MSVWNEGHTALGGHITMEGNYLASWQWANNLPWPKGLASTLGIHGIYTELGSCIAIVVWMHVTMATTAIPTDVQTFVLML